MSRNVNAPNVSCTHVGPHRPDWFCNCFEDRGKSARLRISDWKCHTFHAMILESLDFWWIWLSHIRDLFLQNFRTSTVVKILICDWRGWKEVLVRLIHRWPTFRFSTTTSGFFQCGRDRAWSFSIQPLETHVGWILSTMTGTLIDIYYKDEYDMYKI